MDREVKTNHAGIKLPSQRQDYIRRNPELCLSELERRKYQVNVGLNIREVEILDAQRGAISRAAYFRGLLSSASLSRHAPIPAVNTKAYAELARLGGAREFGASFFLMEFWVKSMDRMGTVALTKVAGIQTAYVVTYRELSVSKRQIWHAFLKKIGCIQCRTS